MDSVGDTIDVVPIGAWHGKGKRTGGYGSFLLAIYNEEAEEFQVRKISFFVTFCNFWLVFLPSEGLIHKILRS